jgi:glycogen debranching enzyme
VERDRPDEHVDPLVAHLLGADLFSGWGVRTAGRRSAAVQPDGLPPRHDLAARQLADRRRPDPYGRRAQAATLALAMLEAARHFDHRLPEAFVGSDREAFDVPVAYPSACSPQAWAAATPLLLLRCMLGLEPGPEGLTADPHLPAGVGRLALRGVPGRWGTPTPTRSRLGGPGRRCRSR